MFERIQVGGHHSCGIATDGQTYCWGWWDGLVTTSPVEAPGGLQFRAVTVGPFHSCGVTASNLAYCWGNNQSGRLGDGTTEIWRDFPARVVGPDSPT